MSMSAAETAWEPGEPLMPDNGCGRMPSIYMSEERRATVLAEGGLVPPWYRPGVDGSSISFTRTCAPCGVAWRGDDPCWMCGGQEHP